MKNISDIKQDQFIEKVVEVSKNTPVLVDFWAPWCGPCKQLTPVLEKLVNKKNGKILLVKINVDENQEIAGQLNIQSIPTVYGFIDGKPVDAFQGAQPESKIETMIDKLIDTMPGNEVPKLLEEANSLLKNNEADQAKKIYETLIGMDPGNSKIIVGLLRSLIQLQNYEEAKEIINSVDETILQNEEVSKIIKLLENFGNNNNESKLDELCKRLDNNPNDHKLRFELAEIYLKANETEKGFQELLYIFDQNQKWNEEAAKKKLLEYFDLLGFNDPNVMSARKKLSSLMFK
jgi:putative thioredoxin